MKLSFHRKKIGKIFPCYPSAAAYAFNNIEIFWGMGYKKNSKKNYFDFFLILVMLSIEFVTKKKNL
jgi:hypothetical protein